MNKKLILCLCLFAFGIVFAQNTASDKRTPYPVDMTQILKTAETITHDKYPEANAALVNDWLVSTYETDGKYVTYDDMTYKILTEKGKNSYKTLSLFYNISYENAHFLFADIHKPDGSVIHLPLEKLTREMVSPHQMSSNIYNPNSKQLTATVPELEIGDIIHYAVRHETTKPRYPNAYSDIFVLESDDLIVNYVIDVNAPKELPLKRIAVRDPVPGTVTHSVDESDPKRIRYHWQIKNVPVMHPEPQMPVAWTVAQRLMISTIDRWEDVSQWYWNLCKPHLEPTQGMKDKVAELTKGLTKRDDIIRAIFKFVSQEIRYMGITIEDEAPGYEPHDVSLTFNNRHGVCRDKAALLAALLRIAGLEAYPVLFKAGDKMDPEIILPYFNHAITCVRNDDNTYSLMDSTDENTIDIFPQYLSDMSYIVAHPQGEALQTSPFSPAKDNLLFIRTKGDIDDKGTLKAIATLEFTGINDKAYRSHFASSSAEEKRDFLDHQLKQAVPGARITNLSFQPTDMLNTNIPLSVTLEFTAENAFVSGGNFAMFTPPHLSKVLGMCNFILGSTHLAQRKYPYKSRYACGLSEDIDITLNPAWGTPAALPNYQNLNDNNIVWKRDAAFKDGKLTLHTDYSINALQFSPQQYLVLKKQLEALEDNARKRVIFDTGVRPATDENTENDAEIMEHVTTYTLTDATKWTEVTSMKMKILSYNGKKSFSELTFGYNPAWESITINSAKVTTAAANGQQPKTQSVDPKEINLMDESWVAQAPRYSADKKLVVSLPGVEIGSIVEYQFTKTVNGALPFSRRFSFDRINCPVTRRSITVNVPVALKLNTALFQNGFFASSFKAHQDNITETFTSQNNRAIWNWTAVNQAPVPAEDHQPFYATFRPAVFCCTTPLADFIAKIAQIIDAKTVSGPAVEKAVADIAKLPEAQRLEAVNTLLDRTIATAGPNFLNLPLEQLSNPNTTLTDGYGHSADKAIAAFTILRELGFKPQFILASRNQQPEAIFKQQYSLPSPHDFSNLLVRVVKDGQTYWFNDQNWYADITTTTFENCRAIQLEDAKLFTITIPEDKKMQHLSNYTIAISDNGDADITFTQPITGPQYASQKKYYAELTPEYRRRNHLQILKGISRKAIPTSDLTTDFSSYPGMLSFSCKIPQFAVVDGDFIYFDIFIKAFQSQLPRFNADKRQSPLALSNSVPFTRTFTITLPPAFKNLLMAPPVTNWSSPAGNNACTITRADNANGTLTYTFKNNPAPETIFPHDFSKLKDISDKLTHPSASSFLLKK